MRSLGQMAALARALTAGLRPKVRPQESRRLPATSGVTQREGAGTGVYDQDSWVPEIAPGPIAKQDCACLSLAGGFG